MKVKMVTKSGRLPEYKTEGASGMDLEAFLEEPMVLRPGERALVPTGLFMELPQGYEAQVRARSGLSIKHGITCINGIGTVDSDYRGELKVPLVNLGEEDFVINSGDRIAQMIIAAYTKVEPVEVQELDSTERSEGGFGHTGI